MGIHLPAIKLGALALRQAGKYIANYFKEKAKNNRFFREYICIPPAQLYNKMEIRTKIWALHLGQPKTVKPLSEAAAIDLGVNLLGELVLFLVVVISFMLEMSRQARAEKRKVAKQKAEMNKLIHDLQVTEMLVGEQERYIGEMEKTLSSMGHKVQVREPREPFKSKLIRPLIETKSVAVQTVAE